jgi:hypothetical protein
MIQRDITTNADALKLYWATLTEEEIEGLIAGGKVRKRLNNNVSTHSERGVDFGKSQFQLVYVFVTPATQVEVNGELVDVPESETPVFEKKWLNIEPTYEEVKAVQVFMFTSSPRIAGQVIEYYGGMPPL